MPNPDTNSIFYKIGQLTKQKIASEVANVSSGATGYTENIGDNSNTTINVTHNLNSNNLIYSLRDTGTNKFVQTETERVDLNTIKFVFDSAPTTNQYIATIISTDGSTGSGNTCASSPVTITVSSDLSGGLYTTSGANGIGDLFGCINVYRGQTLTIDVVGAEPDLVSHPLKITNYNDLGQAMAPLSGVVKTEYGSEYTLTWTVPCDETVTKYQYQCENHAGMRGTIHVLGSCGNNGSSVGTAFSLQEINTAGNSTQSSTYTHVLYDASSGNIIMDLLSPASHQGVTQHKRIDSSANTVTLSAPSGSTIDGSQTYTLDTQYESIGLFSDGTNYFIQ